MTSDPDALWRQVKPEKHRSQIKPDYDRLVVDVDQLSGKSSAFVPDTMVYIAMAAGADTTRIEDLVNRSMQHHSVVVLSELLQGISDYDPRHPDYKGVRRYYFDLINMIPRSRLILPDEDCWLQAGVIVGTITRTQNFGKSERKELYADALIYLSASKRGLPVLTRNVRDFALIGTVHGAGRIIRY